MIVSKSLNFIKLTLQAASANMLKYCTKID